MNAIDQKYIKNLCEKIEIINYPKNFYFYFSGEKSQFYRLNKAKLRQVTFIDQFDLQICEENEDDENRYNIQLSGDLQKDLEVIKKIVLSDNDFTMTQIRENEFDRSLNSNEVKQNGSTKNDCFKISENLKGIDLVGIISDGKLFRSVIQGGETDLKWFETSRVDIDYSIFSKDKCIKESYSSKKFHDENFNQSVLKNAKNINIMSGEKIELKPGIYNAYYSPSAVYEILCMFNWHGIQAKAFSEKQSVLMDLFEETRFFSEKFSLRENFSLKLSPPFNQKGEESNEIVEIIKNGKLINPLVNSTSEKKYGLNSNQADENECFRSAELLNGEKSEIELIRRLGPGIYISDLHYLNWSNKKNASITGMTRYACFFINESGEKKSIKDMRFNMSLYDLFGSWLKDFSHENKVFCDSNTYHSRRLGGASVPGMLSYINFTI